MYLSKETEKVDFQQQIKKSNSVISKAKTLKAQTMDFSNSDFDKSNQNLSLTPYREIYKSFYSDISAQELKPRVGLVNKYSKLSLAKK
jgi:hypothetical protein